MFWAAKARVKRPIMLGCILYIPTTVVLNCMSDYIKGLTRLFIIIGLNDIYTLTVSLVLITGKAILL